MAETSLAVDTQWVGAADGGCCALTRVVDSSSRHKAPQVKAPLVMVPGMFTGRRFWLSERHIGLAAYLAGCGHPVYIVQRRGLSDSPNSRGRAGLVEHARYDLPAVQDVVQRAHGEPAIWIGHSFGGVMMALAAASRLQAGQIAGLVLFASQFEVGKRMLDWPGNIVTRGITRLRGYFPARAAGLGPENEPRAAMMDACRWVARGRRDPCIKQSLNAVTAPVLALSGSGDRVDPTSGCRRFLTHLASDDITFVEAGQAQGYAVDYDHPGIVISKPAQSEIWPLVADWISRYSG